MKQFTLPIVMLCAASLLTACGSSTTSAPAGQQNKAAAPGTLLQNPPPRLVSLSSADLVASLTASASGQSLLQLMPNQTAACGVDVQYIQYNTVDGHGAPAISSGALMTPNGSSAQCTGARPIVLYAHGTTVSQNYNIANWTDQTNPASGEGVLIAALFAAQGYIVVAPNYVGYDTSTTPYHPYLVEAQQSADMINSLKAARSALPNILNTSIKDSGKLFVTGYSQGGYVALATQKAMQAAAATDSTMTVTASAPGSGPYALSAMVDFIFTGHPDLGAPELATMLITGYQNSYGDVFSKPSDVYTDSIASAGVATLLPYATSDTTAQTSIIPQTALFSATFTAIPGITPAVTNTPADAIFAIGFGDPSLINNTYRATFLADALGASIDPFIATNGASIAGPSSTTPMNAMRAHLVANDLRGYVPSSPTLLCGGDADPVVFFFNSEIMHGEWMAASLPPQAFPLVDVAAAPTVGDGFDQLRGAYAAIEANIAATSGVAAATEAIHGTEAPLCLAAAFGFFANF